MQIDWHKAAIMAAQKWLQFNNAESPPTLIIKEPLCRAIAPLSRRLFDYLNDPITKPPYFVVMWQGNDGTSGMQIIGNRIIPKN